MNLRRRIASTLIGASLLVAVAAAPASAATPAQFGDGSFCQWFNMATQRTTSQQFLMGSWWQFISSWLSNFCTDGQPV